MRMPSARFVQSLVLLVVAFAASAVHAADWTYRVRPSDNIWDLSARYMKSDIPWKRLQDYNKVPDPYRLVPGSQLRIPIEWLRVQPAAATVVAVHGSAQATVPGQSAPVAINAGMSFGYGSQLVTDAEASLTLQFADGSRVLLQQQSELTLDRMSAYGRTGMVDTRLRLQRGRVSSSVTPLTGAAAHFSVETPGTISSVRGTQFRVAADTAARLSRTEVLGGAVNVRGDRKGATVRKGFGVATVDGSAPSKAQSLLPAPVLTCPTQPVKKTPFTLEWPALDGAQKYRVQLAPTTSFDVLLLDKLLDSTPFSLPYLPDGDYAVRVRGSSAEGLEGEDASCAITIAGQPSPPFVIEPQANAEVRGTRPRFRWTRSDQAVAYVWEIASDAEFSTVLQTRTATGDALRPSEPLAYGRYFWRIASRDNQGTQGAFSDAMPLELVEELPPPALDKPVKSKNSLSLGWSPGEPSQRYQVQLDRDAAFPQPATDEIVDVPTIELAKPASGTWYVRVRTIDTDGFEGAWGPTQKVQVSCLMCRLGAAGGGAALLWILL